MGMAWMFADLFFAPRLLRRARRLLCVLAWPLLLVACGGGAERAATPAAQALAERAGKVAQVVDIDLRGLTRRTALSEAAGASVRTAASELFALGEASFAQYFPSHQSDQAAGSFAYRHYPETGAYLIVDQTALQVYVLGGPFGPDVTLVGEVIDFVPCVTVSTGYPEEGLDVPVGQEFGADGPGSDGGVGAASADGAIRGADVRLYDGSGALIGQGVSDEKGTARLKTCGHHTGPYRIVFQGNATASYFDESIPLSEISFGDWRPFTAAESLEAYVPELTQHVVVSPLTDAAARMVQTFDGFGAIGPAPGDPDRRNALTQRSRALATTVRVRLANERVREAVNGLFLGTGLTVADITQPPALAYSPGSVQVLRNNDRGRYAQLLVALAKASRAFNPQLAAPAREMSRQIARDLSDGALDGKDARGEDVAAEGSRAYDAPSLKTTVARHVVGRLITRVSGLGRIAADPVGADCPDGGAGSCFRWGASVKLTAVAASGARFVSWGGACAGVTGPGCVLEMNGEKLALALFEGGAQDTRELIVGKSGSGSVKSTPDGILCGSACSAGFATGQSVVLTATPAEGQVFGGWSGACSGTSTSCTVTMNTDRAVIAKFGDETYSIGGTVAGLTGTGLVLADGTDSVEVALGSSGFRMPTERRDGSSYRVTVAVQPLGQTCSVVNGNGIVRDADVTNVAVTCRNSVLYSVGGAVNGLVGSGFELKLGSVRLPVSPGSTRFEFVDALGNGSSYNVTVASQPKGQACTVSNGSGTIAGAAVTDVLVSCVGTVYTVGGSIAGLQGSGLQLALALFQGEDVLGEMCCVAPAPGSASFMFDGAGLSDGLTYRVYVKNQPLGQYCQAQSSIGVVHGASISDVAVGCGDPIAGIFVPFVIDVSGLDAWGLSLGVLLNDGFDHWLPWAADRSRLDYGWSIGGMAYGVVIVSQPSGQTCTVIDGTGVAGALGAVARVACAGSPLKWQVGGRFSPAFVGTIELAMNGQRASFSVNGANDLADSPSQAHARLRTLATQVDFEDPHFHFPDLLCNGCGFTVTVTKPPAGYACSVINGSGTVDAGPVTQVVVECLQSIGALDRGAAGRLRSIGR